MHPIDQVTRIVSDDTNTGKKFAIIIPARYKSSRFPGKPLVKIAGRELVLRVWDRCVLAVGATSVYIATDDERIARLCESAEAQYVMTSSSCKTGTDRVYEAASALGLEVVINVQGDEPLVDPDSINRILTQLQTGAHSIVNGMCPIIDEDEFRSCTVPKVVVAPDGRLLYMSRSAIPTNKSLEFVKAWKQVCIYGFTISALEAFTSVADKTALEEIEDIEILRFLELNHYVHMVKLSPGSVAVDVPEDVEKAEKVIHELGL